eukprot:gnl/TRDRNA2_/TRDRNA2_130910_c0_seq1.p1 gnl/TRDRNA2_/TRDRNA2_130910_c0~~gnl/TRDRNA2_/TRDRNA2_130910_c0_seq1.p1  ORF type:complete len:183 (+),score=10.80 gnl/TRDRNA2_/TRDRNA2_130910_c0_seq1:31-549(+)
MELDPPTCEPSQPVHVLHFHGTSDAIIPFHLGQISIWLFSRANGCGGKEAPALPELEEKKKWRSMPLFNWSSTFNITQATRDECPVDGQAHSTSLRQLGMNALSMVQSLSGLVTEWATTMELMTTALRKPCSGWPPWLTFRCCCRWIHLQESNLRHKSYYRISAAVFTWMGN